MLNRAILFKNRYFIISALFIIWMLFIDKNSLIVQMKIKDELNAVKAQKEYYIKEIKMMQEESRRLDTDFEYLEKLARERYLMKRDNEEIFLFIEETKGDNQTK